MPVYREKRAGRENRLKVRIWHKGKAHEWSFEGTREEAVAFEARERVKLEAQGSTQRTVPRFLDFSVGAYAEHAKTHLKARTWSNRQYTIATLSEHLGPLRLTEIDNVRVEQYQRDRLGLKIRPSTINDEAKVLRAILAYAKATKVPVCELTAKDLPVRGKRRAKAWTVAEVDRLLRAVAETSPHIYWIVVFLLHTGCRRGEALAAEWSWVDLKRRVLSIQPNDEWQPKDGEPREIPIPDALLPYLQAPRKHERWVFPTTRKSRLRSGEGREKERYILWPQLAFDRARKRAKLTGGPHTTRHTFASHFLARVPDLWLLARLLGHSTTQVTELYAHLLPDAVERARGAVSFALPTVSPQTVGNTVGGNGSRLAGNGLTAGNLLWGVQDSDLRLPPCEERTVTRKASNSRR
jgi:integrase